MEGSPRRLSAVNIFSNFFQGRRHSSSDPLLRILQRRRSSAVEVLSSSTHRVMVAISSVNPAELNATFPEKKRNSRRPTAKYTKIKMNENMLLKIKCVDSVKHFSTWNAFLRVTDNILAMARPSTEIIEKYNIIEQFQRCDIKTVINLQRPGEHASCGNPLEQESGFTYLPEAFMEDGIYFYNFGWKDYGVASLTTILDMVKVMAFALQEGRVAIHCHAGLGRTGVLIACYLVFATRMTADQAILFVRAKRPNSIQTRGQLLCVREFTQFLIPLRNVFACCEPNVHSVTLSQYLIRQRHLLHGYESRHLKYVPKLIDLVCKLLLDLAENRQVIEEELLDIPDLSSEIEETVSQLDATQLDKELTRQNSDPSEPFTHSEEGNVMFETQDSFFSDAHKYDPLWKRRNVESLQPLTHSKRRLSYSDSYLSRTSFLLEQAENPWTVPTQVSLFDKLKQQNARDHLLCADNQTPQLDLNKDALVRSTFIFWSQGKFSLDGQSNFYRKKSPKEVQRSKTFSSGFEHEHNDREAKTQKCGFVKEICYREKRKTNACGRGICASEDSDNSALEEEEEKESSIGYKSQDSKDLLEEIPHIVLQSELSLEARRILAAKALADLNEFMGEEEVKQKVETWQKELNSRDGAWDRLCAERDPFVLCSLMWSWIEQLKEPVITKEDIDMLSQKCTESPETLTLLKKEQYQTIVCILHCVVNLQTIPADVEEAVLNRAIKAFTKTSTDSENGPEVYNTLRKVFKQTLEAKKKEPKEETDNSP
ncbi:protein tyrosine phosphatase domain-containing protein 1 isoform X3 [Carettochelys insculpta]|uniref:protein tyrosine phosphatase domain-containing protein 1 isoform X3 n=2 Tax=Carettochelys insculpta TaxID=44489 RepID=UPI003EB9F871